MRVMEAFFTYFDGHSRPGLGCLTALMSSARFAVSSLTSLRETTQASAQHRSLIRNTRTPTRSSEVTQGVSRSEVKEETAKRAGDMSGGSRPVSLLSGTGIKRAQGEKTWAN
jgi:hypothetical protein